MSTVFVDVDTQLDFLVPAGALYAPGAEKIVERVAKLNRWAGAHDIPVISTTDAHSENDVEFQSWPHHCVLGTISQLKPAATLLENRTVVPVTKSDFGTAAQYVVQKVTTNCFDNPNLEGLLDRLGAARAVVYGVVTEVCVRQAADGLLARGKQVEIVTDAIESLNREDGERILADLQARGAKLTTTDEIFA